MMTKAKVVYRDENIIEIEVGDHLISYGGAFNYFCWNHQSFDCLLNLLEQRMVRAVTA